MKKTKQAALILMGLLMAASLAFTACTKPDDPIDTDEDTTVADTEQTSEDTSAETDPVVESDTDPVDETNPVDDTDPADETDPMEPETSELEGHVIGYLPLDKKVGNKIDNSFASKKNGSPVYDAGFKGAGFVPSVNGSVNLGNWNPDNNSFTVGMWVHTTSVNSKTVVLANQCWSDENTGFTFCLYHMDSQMQICFNFNGHHTIKKVSIPADYMNRWMYVVMAVDRENHQVKISFDFNDFIVVDMRHSPAEGEEIGQPYYGTDVMFNAVDAENNNIPVSIGTDGDRCYNKSSDTKIDEVLVFDTAISNDDLRAIADYYKTEARNIPEYYDALCLYPRAMNGSGMNAEMMSENELSFIRITATNGDPMFTLVRDTENVKDVPFMAIKYRTNATIAGRFFYGSAGGPNGQNDSFAQNWEGDDQWHVAIINLNETGATNMTDNVLGYMRMDFIDSGADEVKDVAYFDMAAVGFFTTEAAANAAIK